MSAAEWDLDAIETVVLPRTLADALDALDAHLNRYVYFVSEHDRVAVALWCAGTHCYQIAETFPILAFMSPVRRSGKTRGMDTIEPVVARPWRVIRPSESVLFRKIDRDRPTLMLDEVDAIWSEKNEHEGLRAVLNAGNRRGTTVARTVAKGKTFDLVDFEVYCPKALAGIGRLPETVADRAIVIHMVRKGVGDRVERLRMRDAFALGEPIGQSLAELLSDVSDLTLRPDELPDALDDRAQDGWEPLLAIAKRAGGQWLERAHAAAVALSSERDDVDDESLGIVLLRDIRTALGDEPRLTTAQLIERLLQIELAPWQDMYGKPINGRRLSKLLRPFGVKPHRDRVGSVYVASQFHDAWSRYLPSESATSATDTTSNPEPVAVAADVADSEGAKRQSEPPHRLCPSCHGLHPAGTTCPVSRDDLWPPPEPADDDAPTAWSEVME
jgi:hypothetical protein